MNRPAWKSGNGEPLAVIELAVIHMVAAMLAGLVLILLTGDCPTGFAVAGVLYMILDKVRIILDWAHDVRYRRIADRRMLAALNAAPVRARMAVRP